MDMSHVIVSYRRFLKRRNYSPHTIKNYINILKHFVVWVNVPIEAVDRRKVEEYTDKLLSKKLKPKSINCHLACIRAFYHYLFHLEEMKIPNPVKRGSTLRMSKPLPRHLRDEEVSVLLRRITKPRDKAMVMVMLRCGLRVEELAHLQLSDLDLRQRRIFVHHAKGGKQRVVYISNDAEHALVDYLRARGPSRTRAIFLVEKGRFKGNPISVRGIQKRIEHYAKKTGLRICCHQLRHTMATQLLNAEAEVVTIQDLLGHSGISTTERYCTVSNTKVMKDYFKAMQTVMQRHPIGQRFKSNIYLDKNKELGKDNNH
jgi:site-specific recombinase XerD